MLCVFCVCQYRGRRKKHLEVKACAVLDFALSTLMWTLHHCASVLYGVHTHAPLAECVPEIVNVRERTCIYVRRWAYIVCLVPVYWVIQAGLLTPLTFAQHRLSPLDAFTSGVYFLHNGRRWQWICEFYIANFWRPVVIMCLAITCCLCCRMPQNASFFPPTNSQSSGQLKKWCKDTFFPPSIPFAR